MENKDTKVDNILSMVLIIKKKIIKNYNKFISKLLLTKIQKMDNG